MEEEGRISSGTAFLMIAAAAFIDLIQFILNLLIIGLILNPIISLMAGGLFWLWFTLHGISYTQNARRLISTISVFFFEMTPAGALPLLTLNVWFIIRTAKKEDAEHATAAKTQAAQAAHKAKQAQTAAAQAAASALEEESKREQEATETQKSETVAKEKSKKVENQMESFENQTYNNYANDPKFYEQKDERQSA